MTYPPTNPGQPTNPGYPAPQQSSGYGTPVAPAAHGAGSRRVPAFLLAAVAALGLAAYLAGFGPLLTINTDIGPFGGAEFTASPLSYWTVAALLAALLAAASLLPKARNYTPIVAVSAVLAVLLVISQLVNRPAGFAVGWALWLVLLFTLFQAAAAVAALLYESGVLSAPAPRPRYEQYGQYGPPPGGYYPQSGQPNPAQPPGYPAQYGSYPSGTPTGGYGSPDNSPPTPPTGFPAYTPPTTSLSTTNLPTTNPPTTSEPSSGSTSS